ncbi:MAG: hypothetical protein ACFFG0_56250, partial [Candidatus Thorarchaeota archaeon]
MAKAVDPKEKSEFVEGEAYYCPECKRTHTKGKVYKEHLKYAQLENFEEELNPNTYDDEEELREAFNELEEEDSSDEIDILLEDEKISDNDDDETDLNECVDAVKKLPGVGEATLNKLIKAGFNSLESIAYTPPSIIKE